MAVAVALTAGAQDVVAQTVAVPKTVAEAQDANQVRREFMEVMRKYPPAVSRVLKLDPSLLNNDSYLAPYPVLVAYLAQHPDIRRNPGYYFEPIEGGYYGGYRSESQQIWENMMVSVAVVAVVGTILATLAWIIRTLIDYRRWHRLSKVQSEAHAKLLDRFTANDELIAYVQSPAGAKFLQSAPISLDPGTRTLGAPFSRILWSVQAGLVLAAGGLGLYYVSGKVEQDVMQPLFAMGVLAMSLGVGFVISAAVSFGLSRKLGLFDGSAAVLQDDRREAPRA
jgi:hypothetical protein